MKKTLARLILLVALLGGSAGAWSAGTSSKVAAYGEDPPPASSYAPSVFCGKGGC